MNEVVVDHQHRVEEALTALWALEPGAWELGKLGRVVLAALPEGPVKRGVLFEETWRPKKPDGEGAVVGLRFTPPSAFPSIIKGARSDTPETHLLLIERDSSDLVLRWSFLPPSSSSKSSRYSRKFKKFVDSQNNAVPQVKSSDSLLHRPHGRRFPMVEVWAQIFEVPPPQGIEAWPKGLSGVGGHTLYARRLALDLHRLTSDTNAATLREAASKLIIAFDRALRQLLAQLDNPSGPLARQFQEMGLAPSDGPRPSMTTKDIPQPMNTHDNPSPEEIIDHLKEAGAVVLQGPPGTGKTWLAEQVIKGLGKVNTEELPLGQLSSTEGEARLKVPILWEIVQLHPGYAYEDLVRGIATEIVGDNVVFRPRDGVFVELARLATKRSARGLPTLLVLDEINRCNLSAVLGELILLLEASKRARPGRPGAQVRLQHPDPPDAEIQGPLSLPHDFYILGTMNTADRSIALVDYAIRRRFRFIDVRPSTATLEYVLGGSTLARAAAHAMRTINAALEDAPELRVGHSYFMVEPNVDRSQEARLANRLVYEVLPLLREYHAEGRLRAQEIPLFSGVALPMTGDVERGLVSALENALTSYP